MKFLVLSVSALVFFSGVARADGVAAAEKICTGLYYSNEKLECLTLVNQAKSLDEGAVKICAGLYYTKEKMECLGTVRDLSFTQTSLSVCGAEYYTKDKIACLKKMGKSVASETEVDKAYVHSSLVRALRALQENDQRKAEQIIVNLIDTL